MTIPLTVNGVTFDYPEHLDTGWADEATGWANAITNALQTNSSPLNTKGDLFTYTTEPARLAVGPNGTVLVADSSQPTGLSWLSVPGVSGAVTGFTFIDANGFHGLVTTPTTTPQLTLSMDTLPISGGGTGSTTKDGAFDSIAPTTSAGDIIYHNGVGNVRLPGNPTGKQYVLSNNGLGGISWSLPTYGRQAQIATPCDMNALPTTDLSVEGYGDWLIQGLIGNVANRPPGSSLPMAGSNIGLGPGGNLIQIAYSAGGAIQWIRRKVGGFWSPWTEATLPDQTGQAGKFLFTNGTTTSWQIGGGGGGTGSITSLTVNSTNGIVSTVTNPVGPNTVLDLSLSTTGVSAGFYSAANITVDAFGRITGATNGTIAGIPINNVTNATNDSARLHGPYDINWAWDQMVGVYGTGPQPVRHSGLTLHGIQAANPGEHPIVLRVGVAAGSTVYPFEVYLDSYPGGAIVVRDDARTLIRYGLDITGASTYNGTPLGTVTNVSAIGSTNMFVSVDNPTTTPEIFIDLSDTGVTSGVYSSVSVDQKGRVFNGGNIIMTGDTTGTVSGTSLVSTLSNTGVVPGIYGSTTTIPRITVDAKGRITAATNVSGGGVSTVSVTTTADISGSVLTPTTTPALSLTLTTTGVVAAAYKTANITVDSKGRITAATNGRFLDLADTPTTYTGQAAKVVEVNGAETGLQFTVLAPITTNDVTNVSTVTGVTLTDALNNLKSATTSGTVALTAGAATVNTTLVQANSIIMLTHQNSSGTLGELFVGTKTAGVSFVINSTNAADTSSIGWFIIR